MADNPFRRITRPTAVSEGIDAAADPGSVRPLTVPGRAAPVGLEDMGAVQRFFADNPRAGEFLQAVISALGAIGPGRGAGGPMPFFMNPSLRKPPVVSRSELGAYRPGFDAAGEVRPPAPPRIPVAGEGMDVPVNVGTPRRISNTGEPPELPPAESMFMPDELSQLRRLLERPSYGRPGATQRVGEGDLDTMALPANQNLPRPSWEK